MTDTDTDTGTDTGTDTDSDTDTVLCPECGEDYTHARPSPALRLGLHRRQVHGVAGSGEKKTHRPRGPKPRSADQATTSRAGRAASRKDIEDGTRELYEGIGLFIYMRDPVAGEMIIGKKRLEELANAEATSDGIAGAASKAWAKISRHNETVEKHLGKMLSGSDWAEVIGAHLPLIFLAVQRKPQAVTGIFDKIRSNATRRVVQRKAAAAQAAQARQARPAPPPQGYGYGNRAVPDPTDTA